MKTTGVYQLLEYQGAEGAFVHRAAIFVFCDIYEQLSPAKTCKFLDGVVPKVLTVLKSDQDLSVRQACFYLFGVMAHRCEDKFTKYTSAVLEPCMQCIRSASEKYKKKELAEDATVVVDNALAMVAKIIKHTGIRQVPTVNSDQIMSIWASHLPLQLDVTESIYCHALLLQFVDSNEPAVVGKEFENIPFITKAFAEIIDTDRSNDRLNSAIRQICRKMSSLSTNVKNKINEILTNEEKGKLGFVVL
ncbi:hypothetical protein RFI_27787 [Reticulomyxa filosa]|uniref:Uncharacterized protein n=1 Tax=Reticulomyxa filosa TaxID=46433 RepID=X6M994_RETFI|nr:hypothetical protein RFI_27787 [Reticulomyxa filosa]|eukprot:ETO09590.1 hypothetical protein RFI_27787 [Reticulomyxa filosa]